MAFKKVKKSKGKEMRDLAFVGPLFIGLAFGMLYGRPDVGVLAGLGCGFLASMLVRWKGPN